jgi:hypothetical protein
MMSGALRLAQSEKVGSAFMIPATCLRFHNFCLSMELCHATTITNTSGKTTGTASEPHLRTLHPVLSSPAHSAQFVDHNKCDSVAIFFFSGCA